MDLTKRIVEVRESKKITKSEVAQKLNIDLSNYFRVEKKGAKLTYEQIEGISNALGISVKELLFAETDMVQEVDARELEDLRKENEKLKLEVSYEKLLRTSKEDRINALCWGYIEDFIEEHRGVDYHSGFLNWNKELFKNIIKELFPNDRAVELFVEKNKQLLEGFKGECKSKVSFWGYDIFGFFFNNVDKVRFKKIFFQEIYKKLKNPFENQEYIKDFFQSIADNSLASFWYFQLLFEQKLVSDINLLNLAPFIEIADNTIANQDNHSITIAEVLSNIDILLKNDYLNDFIKELTNYPNYGKSYSEKNPNA